MFLLSPPAAGCAAAATCFCSNSKTPARFISKYLQYHVADAYCPRGLSVILDMQDNLNNYLCVAPAF